MEADSAGSARAEPAESAESAGFAIWFCWQAPEMICSDLYPGLSNHAILILVFIFHLSMSN